MMPGGPHDWMRGLLQIMPHHDEEKLFQKGIEEFNSRRFFEAHETWEEIWLTSPQPEKKFMQGIIQVAAAFHHHSRGNRRGTRSLLREGVAKLEQFPAVYRGLDIEALRNAAREWIEALAAGKDPGAARLPRVHARAGK